MNDVDLILSQNDKFRFVDVCFNGKETTYAYKTVLDLVVGDGVLVPVERADGLTASFAIVSAISKRKNTNEKRVNKWVVQKVDFSHYEKCCAAQEAIEEELDSVREKKLMEELLGNLAGEIGEDGIKRLSSSLDSL